MSLADEILSVNDRQGVEVQAWGKTLRVVPMSGIDRDSYDLARHRANGNMENWRAQFLVRCLFDAEGNRIFTDEQAGELGKKHSDTIKRLFELATEENKTGPGAVEEAAKNS